MRTLLHELSGVLAGFREFISLWRGMIIFGEGFFFSFFFLTKRSVFMRIYLRFDEI